MQTVPEEIRHAAMALGQSLRREGFLTAYLEAAAAFRSNEEAAELEKRLLSLYQELMARQDTGQQLSREEVQGFHDLRRQVQAHPAIVERDRALQAAKPRLAEIADEISLQLGADYTTLARRE